jgi:hypothetical protein
VAEHVIRKLEIQKVHAYCLQRPLYETVLEAREKYVRVAQMRISFKHAAYPKDRVLACHPVVLGLLPLVTE